MPTCQYSQNLTPASRGKLLDLGAERKNKRRVFRVLSRLIQTKASQFLSQQEIADELSIHRNTVAKDIEELVQDGYLDRNRSEPYFDNGWHRLADTYSFTSAWLKVKNARVPYYKNIARKHTVYPKAKIQNCAIGSKDLESRAEDNSTSRARGKNTFQSDNTYFQKSLDEAVEFTGGMINKSLMHRAARFKGADWLTAFVCLVKKRGPRDSAAYVKVCLANAIHRVIWPESDKIIRGRRCRAAAQSNPLPPLPSYPWRADGEWKPMDENDSEGFKKELARAREAIQQESEERRKTYG